eukprot:Rhum_TRINITY_DN21635_c0_g1::Rhum_TRINITY_DN21635_c0_g1_i1::g.174455::m.174455
MYHGGTMVQKVPKTKETPCRALVSPSSMKACASTKKIGKSKQTHITKMHRYRFDSSMLRESRSFSVEISSGRTMPKNTMKPSTRMPTNALLPDLGSSPSSAFPLYHATQHRNDVPSCRNCHSSRYNEPVGTGGIGSVLTPMSTGSPCRCARFPCVCTGFTEGGRGPLLTSDPPRPGGPHLAPPPAATTGLSDRFDADAAVDGARPLRNFFVNSFAFLPFVFVSPPPSPVGATLGDAGRGSAWPTMTVESRGFSVRGCVADISSNSTSPPTALLALARLPAPPAAACIFTRLIVSLLPSTPHLPSAHDGVAMKYRYCSF